MKHVLILLALIPTTALQTGQEPICRKPYPIISPTELKCLSVTIYGEARGERELGQVAVAYSVKNRTGKKTLCQVALAHKQYSVFNNNPALRAAALSMYIQPDQKNVIDKQSWKQAVLVARMVAEGYISDPTFGATHYLAPHLMRSKGYKYPKWALQYKVTAEIDNHKFFLKS